MTGYSKNGGMKPEWRQDKENGGQITNSLNICMKKFQEVVIWPPFSLSCLHSGYETYLSIFLRIYLCFSGSFSFSHLSHLNQDKKMVQRSVIFIVWKGRFWTVAKTQLFAKRCVFIIFLVLKSQLFKWTK